MVLYPNDTKYLIKKKKPFAFCKYFNKNGTKYKSYSKHYK